MENTTHGPLPLVVGVTGHVDLQTGAHEALAASVHTLLRSLGERFNHSDIWVMTALAEGADQLVAEAAASLRLPLVAVLPMPLADYERTLPTAAGRERLHALWNKAALRLELPWIGVGTEPNRDELQYEQVGLVITHFSHIMLALWNGVDASKPTADGPDHSDQQGGTAHIVYLRAVGEYESSVYGRSPIFPYLHTKLYPVESGLTFRIATPRESTTECVGAAGSLWLRTGKSSEVGLDAGGIDATLGSSSGNSAFHPMEDEALDTLEATQGELAKLNKANCLLALKAQKCEQSIAQSADRLLPPDTLQMLGVQKLPANAIRNAHAMADVFSQANRWRIHGALLFLILSLLSSVVAFETYVHGCKPMLRWYVGFIVSPAVAYWFFIRPLRWQTHFQDFRALAEALRVQLFWGLSGISCGVQDFYMRKHQDELTWIRTALRGTALHALAMGLGPVQREVVTRCWIERQFDYFSGARGQPGIPGKAEYNEKKWKLYERRATAAYAAGALIAIGLLLAEVAGIRSEEHLHDIVVTLIGFAPALAGAFLIFSEKLAYKDHAHQYSRMGRIFGKALALVMQLDVWDDSEFTLIVRELGAEALAENGDWLISHRDRRVEPIRGG